MSFFNASLEQIYDEEREQIQSNAIATRGAKLEKFDEFLKLFDKKKQKREVSDHQANMAMMSKKL